MELLAFLADRVCRGLRREGRSLLEDRSQAELWE